MYFERGSRSGVCERCEKWANKASMDFGEGGRCWEEVWLFLYSQLGRRIELLRPRDVDSSGGRQKWKKSLLLTQPPSKTSKTEVLIPKVVKASSGCTSSLWQFLVISQFLEGISVQG